MARLADCEYEIEDKNLDILFIGVLEDRLADCEMSKDLEIDKLQAQIAYLMTSNQEIMASNQVHVNRFRNIRHIVKCALE